MSWAATSWASKVKTGSPAIKLVLLTLANFADDEGYCFPSQKTLAEITECGERSIRRYLDKLESMGIIRRVRRHREDGSRTSDGVYLCMGNLPAKLATGQIGHRPNDAEPSGQALAAHESSDEYPDSKLIHGTSGDGPSELELTPPSSSPAKNKRKAIDYTQEFEEAWSAYPKREGSNNKRKAFSAWNARLREGVAPEEMLAGVKRYAAYCDAKDATGTQWVMQAQRFFGKDREFENDWSVAQQPSGATQRRASPHGGYDKIDYSRGIDPDGRF
jgi:hypothetical protein